MLPHLQSYSKPRPTLLHDDEVQHREIVRDDATPDRLPPALAIATAIATEAAITGLHQHLDTVRSQDTLLHWESLLVLSSQDLEDVALELLIK